MSTNPVDALPDALYQRRLDAALANRDTAIQSDDDHECWLVNGHVVLMSEERGWFCDCEWWERTHTACRHMALVTSILRARKAVRASINA